jgi:hypothetical protein
MATKAPKISPSDLPTKKMRAPDGTLYSMKVVQSDSATLGLDLQAAFRWNVSRIRAEQRKRARAENNAA